MIHFKTTNQKINICCQFVIQFHLFHTRYEFGSHK